MLFQDNIRQERIKFNRNFRVALEITWIKYLVDLLVTEESGCHNKDRTFTIKHADFGAAVVDLFGINELAETG